MKIQKKTLIVGISTFFSIVIASYLWDFIKLPYYETEIKGEYSINKYNANNEILRYLFFILFPVLIFLILEIIFNKITFYNLISQINIKKNKNLDSTNFNHLIKFIVIFLILLELFGIIVSLVKSFIPSAKGWKSPKGPTTLGPFLFCTRAHTLLSSQTIKATETKTGKSKNKTL